MDSQAAAGETGLVRALIINASLLSIFALQSCSHRGANCDPDCDACPDIANGCTDANANRRADCDSGSC